ncbi:MAG: hypothetical protein JO073_10335, partial [Actinobacteria bacterium]|nr:hypothetical protein [Actinomycetota bacterium]
LLALVLALVVASGASAAPKSCGTLSVRAGNLRHGATNGPACLLKAFKGCQVAAFTLSNFGVDTVATDTFTVAKAGSGCHVGVVGTFRVVPQTPRTLTATCRALKASGTDVVATGCTGGIPGPISLTGRH